MGILIPATATGAAAAADLGWYSPSQTQINNLTSALSTDGTYGFIFNTSANPDGEYGKYNWCNMPHVRKTEYVKASPEYKLKYVELIHRHHKRTPYASNSFPVEPYPWNCNDEALYYYGQKLPVGSGEGLPAETYWDIYTSETNPFVPSGWLGSCQFPQITADGLDDSYTHGADLYGVYHDLLGFLPSRGDESWRSKVAYRVTTNQITAQVAGGLIGGMWGPATSSSSVPLLVQASAVDSLEPAYTCSVSANLFGAIKSSANSAWAAHFEAAASLYAELDAVSGVPSDDSGFHASFDHYFDNLSARQCHSKPLPCNATTGSCVTQDMANAVYRLGEWEYSQIYRDAADSLPASVASLGVWVAELAAHLRAVTAGTSGSVVYFHNIAHDGSVSRLLSILQVDVMVWPGMGSEVVFELYQKKQSVSSSATSAAPYPISTLVKSRSADSSGSRTATVPLRTSASSSSSSSTNSESASGFYIRVLFGGQTLRSSHPDLGLMDMLPVETLLAYFDGLVGVNANLVAGLCDGSISSTSS
ncbi:histidine phosphatase superfamily [Xylariales sp. PMI_506]|nr:histidine phosphatase superfamily [Xylariales sp. PMI_506]